MISPCPPPLELRRHDLARAETNRPADRAIAIDPKTVAILFGAELLAAASRISQSHTP